MILKANYKYIDMSSVRHLLAHGEKNADFLTFEVDRNYHGTDLAECTFVLRAVNSAGNLVEQTLKKRTENNFIFLTWKVDEYFTAVSGVLKLEIRGILGDELIIKYSLSDIFVRESAVGEGLPEIPDITVIQGEKGDKGDNGLSAYEIWLEQGNIGEKSDFLKSLKGEKGDSGERGLQGVQGEKGEKGDTGLNGENGKNGKSAYEIWLEQGNTGEKSDFLKSLKGEKGDAGERGLQGVQGENGRDGADGFSPLIEVAESTENSYKLRITDKNSSFETPNMKGTSGENNSIEVDAELSGTSENPVQNKAIFSEISALQRQISNLNDLISSIQTGGGNLKITTIFDSENLGKYKNLWNFRCSQWDDKVFSFDEVTAKNSAFCNEENGCSMRFSNSFGWGADVSALFSDSIQISDKSVLIVDYNCTSDGDGMTAEVASQADFSSEKAAEFEKIPAFYATDTYISSVFRLLSNLSYGNYYIRLKVNTTNPVFTIRKISVVAWE